MPVDSVEDCFIAYVCEQCSYIRRVSTKVQGKEPFKLRLPTHDSSHHMKPSQGAVRSVWQGGNIQFPRCQSAAIVSK